MVLVDLRLMWNATLVCVRPAVWAMLTLRPDLRLDTQTGCIIVGKNLRQPDEDGPCTVVLSKGHFWTWGIHYHVTIV